MKTILTFIIISLLSVSIGFSITHTITTSGFSFIPSNLTINLGDTVNFILGPLHNAVEVSQATWDTNGNTSNDGFITRFGGGTIVPNETRIYYYVCSSHASSGMKGTITVNTATSVTSTGIDLPLVFKLSQNFPNPFNPSTTIGFSIPQTGFVTIKIFNIIGQYIQTLFEGEFNPGTYKTTWIANDQPSGIYFYQIKYSNTAGHSLVETKRLFLMK